MNEKRIVSIGARLAGAVPFVTPGGRVADIGTDHAYLPIFLLQNGIVSHALACDINEGPLAMARANIRAAGFSALADTCLTDGLHGVEAYHPDDIIIFGMGGELILRILEEADWVRDPSVGLILQPMTRAAVLRRWLAENGFAITGESIVFEDKYYQIIAARYTGVPEAHTDVEYTVGWQSIANRPPLFEAFVRHEIHVLQKIVRGKALAKAAEGAEEEHLITQLEALL